MVNKPMRRGSVALAFRDVQVKPTARMHLTAPHPEDERW